MRVERLLMFSMGAFLLSFVLTVIFKPAWLLLVLGSTPLLITGGMMAANYQNMVRATPYRFMASSTPPRLFGLLIFSFGLTGISMGLGGSRIPALVSISDTLLNATMVPLLIGLIGPLIAVQYNQKSSTWRRRGEAGVVQLIEVLKGGKQSMNRITAARILGELGDPAAVEPLIAALGDKTAMVRASSAQALGNLGDPRALPALLRMQEHETGVDAKGHPIKEIAAEAIGQIQTQQTS